MKKQMTKAQVKRAANAVIQNMYKLIQDKLGYGTKSYWPMSYNKTVETYRAIQSASFKYRVVGRK